MTANLELGQASSSLAEKELQARMREADNARRALNNGPGKDKKEKLRDACEGFEAMFIQKMWEGMRATLPQDGLMHGRDEKFWQGMYDQELGKSMAKSGGIGLADMMVAQLSRDLQDAGAVAASSRGRRPLDIQPAPLLTAAPQETPKAAVQAAPASTADIYSGAAEQPAAPEPVEAAQPANPVSTALEDLAGQVIITRTIRATTDKPSGIPVLPRDHPVVSGRPATRETNSEAAGTDPVTPYSAPVRTAWQPVSDNKAKPSVRQKNVTARDAHNVQPNAHPNVQPTARPAGQHASSGRSQLTPEAILTGGPELASTQAAQSAGKPLPTVASAQPRTSADLLKQQFSGQSAVGAAVESVPKGNS